MRHCYVLRVFTQGNEGGNHLGVVIDLTGLDDALMQSIAADLGFSETVFVDATVAEPICRIFTPTAELPFAGHPLVGAAWLLHHLSPLVPARLVCGVGPINVHSADNLTTITAPGSQAVTPLTDADCVGLGLGDIVSVFSVAMPLAYTVVELASSIAVGGYSPDERTLSFHPHGDMLSVWARDGVSIHARFFAPGHGIFEDPATGSAAVALAAVQRRLGHPAGSLIIHQGTEVGMPSAIRLDWDEAHTRVGGEVRHDETRELET